MRKLFIIFAIVVSMTSYAATTAYQYFYACKQVWAIDANASTAEVLYWMDKIEANCNK
ncbi:MAG: hypothetical protein Q4F50_17560 [Bacteroides sp.]|uniref:hypothetical protein n=1 Tax=Bacteroides sp. TaxID=29523 RepID=UPI0026E00E1F|nr:hypothetical protein [Bacteroides sp.]MDO5421843.1 hypothetical protein [Bacteroides sp.]